MNVISFIFIGLFIFWFIHGDHQLNTSVWIKNHLNQFRNFYHTNPILSIASFSIAHVVSAMISIPGSCTSLNALSGAVFGFSSGVCIVYPVTLVSGCLGYVLGRKLPLKFLEKKYMARSESLKRAVGPDAFSFLVMLRLSPLLPYGALNIIFGILKVPFRLFLITTTIGIFFDVVFLNSLGALIGGETVGFAGNKINLVVAFILLFLLSYFVKLVIKRVRKTEE